MGAGASGDFARLSSVHSALTSVEVYQHLLGEVERRLEQDHPFVFFDRATFVNPPRPPSLDMTPVTSAGEVVACLSLPRVKLSLKQCRALDGRLSPIQWTQKAIELEIQTAAFSWVAGRLELFPKVRCFEALLIVLCSDIQGDPLFPEQTSFTWSADLHLVARALRPDTPALSAQD